MTATPDWQRDLATVTELMRNVSRAAEPQELVRIYAAGVRRLVPTDRLVAISRRGLERPYYRITRDSLWQEEINPWTQKERLPLLRGGLFGDLLYGEETRVITDLRVEPDDPSAPYVAGMRALMSLPQFDNGVAMNMALLMYNDPVKVDVTRYPNMVWQSNLFGRATHNMVLRRELTQAYEALDRELQIVGDMQRSLLPETLPEIPGVKLAAHYQTSKQSGGDYYDLFALPDGKWGILIADVSGHGTPAAVVMAVLHAIVHSYPGPAMPPCEVLDHVNRKLISHYTTRNPAFVTAFYALYDPGTRELSYASAGHNPPRLLTASGVRALDAVGALPLGIQPDTCYQHAHVTLGRGDTVLFYTDGITEAFSPTKELFGEDRLDALLAACRPHPSTLIADVLDAVRQFTADAPPTDDRTLLAMQIV